MELLNLFFTILVVAGLAWGCQWVIKTYFPQPMQTFALIGVGLLLLMALLYFMVNLLDLPPLRLGG